MLPLYLPIQVLGVELVSQTVNSGFDMQSSSVKHSSTGTKMKKCEIRSCHSFILLQCCAIETEHLLKMKDVSFISTTFSKNFLNK